MLDILLDFFGIAPENLPDLDVDGDNIDSADLDDSCTDATGNEESDSNETDGDSLIGEELSQSTTTISGNNEVDDMLTNGIDTGDSSCADAISDDKETHKHGAAIPFTGAAKCNLCSCGHYVGRDGVDDVCVCGHKKWQHEWV